LSLKVVIFLSVIVLYAVTNFALLRAFTLEEDNAIEEQYFIPHQTTNSSSSSNTAAKDIEARRNATVNIGKPTIATNLNANFLLNKPLKNRNKHNKQQKRIKSTVAPLKIPTPVLLVSLPKSGTTSVWRYFICGGQLTSHNAAIVNETWSNKTVRGTGRKVSGNIMVSGECMKWNALAGRPFLAGCGNYNVWTDTGFVPNKKPICYYPGIEGLEEWFKYYPNSTIILTTRSVDSWVDSVARWEGGVMLNKWERCNLTGFVGREPKELAQFYEWHVELVRDFARKHPSITYIEVSLEDPNMASILHAKTRISLSCWGDCKPRRNKCTVPNATSASYLV
jgi:hypothetical protein